MSLLQVFNQELEDKCTFLLRDDGIFFAGFINNNGRLFAGGFKENSQLIESETTKQMLCMTQSLTTSMRQDFDHCFGPVHYTVSKGKKITMISFKLEQFVFLSLIDSNHDVISMVEKIEKVLMD